MKQKRPIVFTALLLMFAVGNYFRIHGNENIRTIQFLSIFVIGLLTGVLLRELVSIIKNNNK